MIPQKGQHIKCIMRNNLIIDGIVESWSGAQSVLRSIDNTGFSIIQHTDQDIVAIKIIIKDSVKIKNELEEKFEEVHQLPSSNELRIKNMAELKTMMAEQEKQIISEKIKNHHIKDIKRVIYEQPRFFQKSRTK